MKHAQHMYSLLFLFCVYLFIYACTSLTPLLADDYIYSFNLATGESITSFSDILQSQIHHYFTWIGRSISHFLAQAFIFEGKAIFNLVNAFVFILLILLIYWLYRGEKPNIRIKISPLLAVFFCVWSFVKVFGETVFWLIGSCNYLWMTVCILTFLLPYRLYYSHPESYPKYNTWYFSLFIFFFGIIAGWTNENTALSMLLLLVVSIFYFHRKKQVQAWMLMGFAGALIGYSIMITAPGNYVKLALTIHKDGYTFFSQIEHTILMLFKMFFVELPLWILLIWGIQKIKNSRISWTCSKELYFSFAFIGLSIITILVMAASPDFPNRATFGSSIYLIIGALSFLHTIRHEFHLTLLSSKAKNILIALTSCFLIGTMGLTLYSYTIIHKENTQRIQYIFEQKQQHNLNPTVKPFSVKSGSVLNHVFVRDIETNSNYWINIALAKYYGLESINLSK